LTNISVREFIFSTSRQQRRLQGWENAVDLYDWALARRLVGPLRPAWQREIIHQAARQGVMDARQPVAAADWRRRSRHDRHVDCAGGSQWLAT
jgi:hypothetical protein